MVRSAQPYLAISDNTGTKNITQILLPSILYIDIRPGPYNRTRTNDYYDPSLVRHTVIYQTSPREIYS